MNYAHLYAGLLDIQELLTDFQDWMPFYARLISDGIGIWLTDKPGSKMAWKHFKQRINNWGQLRWTNTGHVKKLVFLVLIVSINSKNKLEFRTYRMPNNLYLYLPPTSTHPQDTIHSLVFGRVLAYYLHNTFSLNFIRECGILAVNLIKSGW